MKFLIDYNCTINYHPGKDNVVADAPSRKNVDKLQFLRARQRMFDEMAMLRLTFEVFDI